MPTETRTVIADDHLIVRKGLRQIIEEQPDLKVLAEASDGQTALALIRDLRPDIAVLDLHMPAMGGFEVMREIRKTGLPAEIIFLTLHHEVDLLHQAMDMRIEHSDSQVPVEITLAGSSGVDLCESLGATSYARNTLPAFVRGNLADRPGKINRCWDHVKKPRFALHKTEPHPPSLFCSFSGWLP